MPNYETVPIEFAMGVLQLRSALAQKKSELNEMAAARRSREAIASAQTTTQANIASGQQATQLRLGEIQAETWREKNLLEFKEQLERNKIARENSASKAMESFAAGEPFFLPKDIKRPEKGFGDFIELPEPNGLGSFWVPKNNTTWSKKIQLLDAQYKNVQADTLNKLAYAQYRTALESRAKSSIAETPAVVKSAILKEAANFALLNQTRINTLLDDPDRAKQELGMKLQKDPFYGMTEDRKTFYKDLTLKANEILKTDSAAINRYIPTPPNLDRMLQAIQISPDISEEEIELPDNYITLEQAGIAGLTHDLIWVDDKFQIHQKPAPGLTQILRKSYKNSRDQVVGEAFLTSDGSRLLYTKGTTPFDKMQKVGKVMEAPRLPAPMLEAPNYLPAGTQTYNLYAPLSEEEYQQMEELLQKGIENVTPEEEALLRQFYQRLESSESGFIGPLQE